MSSEHRSRWRDSAGAKGGSKGLKAVVETVVLLAVAVVLAVLVKTFLVQAFYIPSASMEPGLQGGPGVKVSDRILVEKPSYEFGGTPQRGDIIVFSDPGHWLDPSEDAAPSGLASVLERIGLYPAGGHLVKRVIGVAGDKIVCCDSHGRISVNGTPLAEDDFIAPQTQCDGPMAGCTPGWSATVPKGKLFVMGDNRGESADSSYHLCRPGQVNCNPNDAFVSTNLVVGKVVALVWPLNRFKIIHRPEVFSNIPPPQG